MDLQYYFDKYNIKHFKPSEVLIRKPPADLLKNIIPTVIIADQLREKLGSELLITSAYRDPEFNKSIGGASHSLHLKFNALDLVPYRVDPSMLWFLVDSIPFSFMFEDKFIDISSMGVGKYDWGIHIDTRGVLGQPMARWDFRTKKG